MIRTIENVNEEFFKQFANIQIARKNSFVVPNFRYAKKSSGDYTEEDENQIYPCISVQDYSPRPVQDHYIVLHEYFGGLSEDGLSGFLYRRPIWLEFTFDVSIASKSYHEYLAMQQYFLSHFVNNETFLFNQKLTEEDAVGDVVPYTIRGNDIPRTDGVHETNYEFTLRVWLALTEPRDIECISEVILSMDIKDV